MCGFHKSTHGNIFHDRMVRWMEAINMEQGITSDKTFQLSFYDYGKPFYGSYKGMRYRIARDPLENVYGKSQEIKEEGKLVAIVWPGPESYELVAEESKIKAEFPYTRDGKLEVVDWLNQQYEKNESTYKKIYQIIR